MKSSGKETGDGLHVFWLSRGQPKFIDRKLVAARGSDGAVHRVGSRSDSRNRTIPRHGYHNCVFPVRHRKSSRAEERSACRHRSSPHDSAAPPDPMMICLVCPSLRGWPTPFAPPRAKATPPVVGFDGRDLRSWSSLPRQTVAGERMTWIGLTRRAKRQTLPVMILRPTGR